MSRSLGDIRLSVKSSAGINTPKPPPKPSKTPCPLTKEQFLESAKSLTLSIEGQLITVPVKQFKTGSFGWYASQNITLLVDSVPVKAHVGLNLVVVGSKGST
jgi:hypothetical protein